MRPSTDWSPTLPARTLVATGAAILLVVALLAWLQERVGLGVPLPLGSAFLTVYLAVAIVHLEAAFILLIVAACFSIEQAVPGTGGALQVPTEPMLLVTLGIGRASVPSETDRTTYVYFSPNLKLRS